ncbi:hypothetical protein M8C21_005879, partial [Ambrosia artemisiifolia]
MATELLSNTSRLISLKPTKLSTDRPNGSYYSSRTSSCMLFSDRVVNRGFCLRNGVKHVSALVKESCVGSVEKGYGFGLNRVWDDLVKKNDDK